ncbi:biotin transporter BioY [Acidipila sp. EB88]|uniref:biotin transporter BioY n=1 Tax=Acidipila sp. EB88 TaxID=2305226 RepID=UPI000F5F144F|nr:biotin transporter BioY [Acidipila sp. EB88]
MNKPATLPAYAHPTARSTGTSLLAPATMAGRVGAALLGSLFVAVCAQIAVPLPWTPVPMTMQPFAVLLVALLLGPGLGFAAMAAYLLEGAAGLPVFVPGFGGLMPLGASAGYLLSYPFVAMLVGALARHRVGFLAAAGAAAAGDCLILLSGACWLSLFTHGSLLTAARLGILPFVGGDAIKVALAAAAATGAAELVKARRISRRP